MWLRHSVVPKENPGFGWTDPLTDYERQVKFVHHCGVLSLHTLFQLQLHPLNPKDPHQQFRITDN